MHTELVIGAEDANVFLLITEKNIDFLCHYVSHVLWLAIVVWWPYCQPCQAASLTSGMLEVGGRRAGLAAVPLVFHRRGPGDLMVVVHWCCILLHNLFARVSWVVSCAPAGIGSYQGLGPIALGLLQHSQVVESP